jgi:predicted signal transduction protein with EAL and GGDEF domain
VLRVVKAITVLCHDLGRVVVVEGVETRASWARLAALGCDLAQGYCVSPPRHPDDIDALLARLSAPGGTSEPRRSEPRAERACDGGGAARARQATRRSGESKEPPGR